ARQLVSSGQQGSGYSLVVMGSPPRVVIGEPSLDRDDFIQEIDSLEVSHGGANLLATLADVQRIIRPSTPRSASPDRFARRQVYVFSDLQQATWGDVTSPACRASLRNLESRAALNLIDLG